MQVSITDEMIEQLVREQIKTRVNQYFGQLNKENSFFMIDNIKSAIRTCVQEEIEKIADENFVRKVCNDLSRTNLKDKIVESFTARICRTFEEDC